MFIYSAPIANFLLQIFMRYGRQRWKLKGRIEVNSRQSWDGDEMVFMPLISDLINIKVWPSPRFLRACVKDRCPGPGKLETAQTSHLIFTSTTGKACFLGSSPGDGAEGPGLSHASGQCDL